MKKEENKKIEKIEPLVLPKKEVIKPEKVVSKVVSKMIPKVEKVKVVSKSPPKVTPKVVSKVSPNVVSKGSPKVVSKGTPKVVSKVSPNILVLKSSPNVVSKSPPKVTPKSTPKMVSKVVTKVTTKATPNPTPSKVHSSVIPKIEKKEIIKETVKDEKTKDEKTKDEKTKDEKTNDEKKETNVKNVETDNIKIIPGELLNNQKENYFDFFVCNENNLEKILPFKENIDDFGFTFSKIKKKEEELTSFLLFSSSENNNNKEEEKEEETTPFPLFPKSGNNNIEEKDDEYYQNPSFHEIHKITYHPFLNENIHNSLIPFNNFRIPIITQYLDVYLNYNIFFFERKKMYSIAICLQINNKREDLKDFLNRITLLFQNNFYPVRKKDNNNIYFVLLGSFDQIIKKNSLYYDIINIILYDGYLQKHVLLQYVVRYNFSLTPLSLSYSFMTNNNIIENLYEYKFESEYNQYIMIHFIHSYSLTEFFIYYIINKLLRSVQMKGMNEEVPFNSSYVISLYNQYFTSLKNSNNNILCLLKEDNDNLKNSSLLLSNQKFIINIKDYIKKLLINCNQKLNSCDENLKAINNKINQYYEFVEKLNKLTPSNKEDIEEKNNLLFKLNESKRIYDIKKNNNNIYHIIYVCYKSLLFKNNEFLKNLLSELF